jgi:hypothetical protein
MCALVARITRGAGCSHALALAWLPGCAEARNPDAQRFGEANTNRKRIEITIETEWMLTIRRSGCSRLWCRQCGCEADVVQAETLTGMGQPRLGEGAEVKKWHLIEGPDGTPLVCLESLLKSM